MIKYLLLTLPLITSITLAQPNQVEFFYQDQEGTVYHVHRVFVDKILRDIPAEHLETVMEHLAIRPVKMDNGDYALHAHGRLRGGGAGGATAGVYIGKFAVHFVAHGTILLISACTGPAAPATAASLELTFLPAIEAASNVGAIAGGIIGGVATGPV